MKLSLTGVVVAAALVKASGFLFVALMNVFFRPYGGAYLALLTSIYPGYDPVTGPLSLVLGTLYSLMAGAVAGLLFGWLYNLLADRL